MRQWDYLYRDPENLPTGLDAWVGDRVGAFKRRRSVLARLQRMAQQTQLLREQLTELDTGALHEVRQTVLTDLRRDPVEANGRLPGALALLAEISQRALGLTPHPVQLLGVLSLHYGYLAEMATGEGKTLTVGLAAILAAWSGRTCHVITANDYLAQRDAQSLQPLFAATDLVVGSALEEQSPEERQKIYRLPLVYVTAKTLLADYLRDRITARRALDPAVLELQRFLGQQDETASQAFMLSGGLHTALVDEADNVLIDEAVTPLILSEERDVDGLQEAVYWARDVAANLHSGRDFQLDRRNRTLELEAGAFQSLELEAWRLPPHWRGAARREELVRHALVVRHFFERGHQYLVQDDKVVLMDEFSGRMTPERSLNGGLHQAIEAAEELPVTPMKQSIEQMSFQNFFRRFKRLSGTTGTGFEARNEFWRVYGLAVLRIPTHRPRQVQTLPIQYCRDSDRKWQMVCDEVQAQITSGRAVLIGVRSVASSLALSQQLSAIGLQHALLNAEQVAEEAQIIANAGQPGRVTVATNMAGRGTDIRLDPKVREQGGLHVIIAECNESARIDRQLAGRCGRQGDPGSLRVMLSADDPLLRRFGAARWMRWSVSAWIQRAQRIAEGDAFQRRLGVLRQDTWLHSALPFDGLRG